MLHTPRRTYFIDKFSSLVFSLLFTLYHSALFSQTEGWTSACATNTPSVSEVMVDACGNEFQSEYTILRNGNQPFDISQLAIKVINPTNNAFIGDVTIGKGNLNSDALNILTEAAGKVCSYGTIFRNLFSPPYNGIVPENSVILFFVNKDSTDVSYLSPNTLTSLCGSKVFVAFGDLKPQSRGASIFRNYPQNGSCGAGGCMREIQFYFGGLGAPFCTQMIYDIKKLPHLNTSNPPAGFNEGSYIRPNPNGQILYGGGNLTGQGVCLSPEKLYCKIPAQPDFGEDFWNVSVFEGANNFTNFKGFYQAKGNHAPSETGATTGSFEYNTAKDGWNLLESPSEAHPTYGALRAFDGCNVETDNFSLLAKRRGFPCGNYAVNLVKYDEPIRIQIDDNGDGVWDFDKTLNPPTCASGCNTTIWTGTLGSDSKINIFSSDTKKDFNTTVIFDKKSTSPSPIQITSKVSPTNDCLSATGSISLALSGGKAPYTYTWTGGVSTITNNTLLAKNLLSGVYKVVVKDDLGCRDSARILVPQTNNLLVNAGRDTSFCAGNTAILRGSASGAPSLNFEWTTRTSESISSRQSTSAMPSISTYYALKVSSSNGCFKTDTVFVKVHDVPYLTLQTLANDTICTTDSPFFKATGAQTYTWGASPSLPNAAFKNTMSESTYLNPSFLTEPAYNIIVKGTDALGCTNKTQAIFYVKSCKICLKNDTILLNKTTCNRLNAGEKRTYFKNTDGCDSLVITNTLFTPLSINAFLDTPKCFENRYGSIRFNNINGGTAPYKIAFNKDTNSLEKLPFLLPNMPLGKHIFTFLDHGNCAVDTIFHIREGRKLQLKFDKIVRLNLGDSFLIKDSSGSIFRSVKWIPSLGLSCDTCLSTLVKPLFSTVYQVRVIDSLGCQVTENVSVFMTKTQRIFAPNSFSPNDDGDNDVFTIFTDGSVASVQTLKVFSRWGNLVFESFDFSSGDISKGWDGRFNGVVLPDGVYIFYADILFKDGKKEVIQGDVSLMR
jgi:gliding motility-associated-like protein